MDEYRGWERYTCVVGHAIEPENLERDTEVQTLDKGAKVLLCRIHGAPIAFSRSIRRPESTDP